MKYLFTASLFFLSLLSLAQQPVAKEKARNVYYYRKGFLEVSTKDSADIIQIISEPDAGEKLYDVQEFYKDGSLRMLGKTAQVHPIVLQGMAVYYYPNRTKKFVANYKLGRPDGDTYQYHPNGKIHMIMSHIMRDSLTKQRLKSSYPDSLFKFEYDTAGNALVENGNGYYKRAADDFNYVAEEGPVSDFKRTGDWKGYDSREKIAFTEKYVNGKLVEGFSNDSAGARHTYHQRIKYAGFKQDISDFFRFLGTNIRYPASSRELNHQGSVVISMRINVDGSADDFKITHHIDPDMDAEAFRVIKLTPSWSPAESYGIKKAQYFTMPVYFTLQ